MPLKIGSNQASLIIYEEFVVIMRNMFENV